MAMSKQGPHSLVVDVGKTNVKVHVLDESQTSLAVHNRENRVIDSGPYPHADITGTWDWMMDVFSEVARDFEISDIAVSTHGATAALVDPALDGDGLVLPVLDYEWQGVDSGGAYDDVRPPFAETFSPKLPAGLNLGRQLYWQQAQFPERFERARAILTYPQYWAWRLSGVMVSELTSLGCHTDLWAPARKTWSSLVHRQGWQSRFPPLVSAWDTIGPVKAGIGDRTGLPPGCRVHAGIHDSNASLLRFLLAMPDKEFCLISSGTWVVCMLTGSKTDVLDEKRDMLANVNVKGAPVPCIRFMGGREYAEISRRCGVLPGRVTTEADIAALVDANTFALPDFSGGSGPFGGREPEISGAEISGKCAGVGGDALATLYCALMVDYCLDLLQSEHDILIAGSYLQNPLLCALVAQLRGSQPVLLSSDTAGTVRGTAQLTNWSRPVSVSLSACRPSSVAGLEDYRMAWRDLAGRRS